MTYADVFASQPFRNQLVTMTLTGEQIKDALEQQWARPEAAAHPAGLERFQLHMGRQQGRRRAHHRREDVAERRSAIDPAARYRVTVNNYLAVGGDGFTVLQARHRTS